MKLIDELATWWAGSDNPLLIAEDRELFFSDIQSAPSIGLSEVRSGDVVVLIGDFDPSSIATLLILIDLKAIIVPLIRQTQQNHEYFFDASRANVVIEGSTVKRLATPPPHPLIEILRASHHAGLVLFSTGTTGRPKAILHDMTLFLKGYKSARSTLKTLNFLLFDHIAGINTLFHTLFNRGTVVVPARRNVECVLETCRKHGVQRLPTTPTFLRMMLMSGAIPDEVPSCIKVIKYGTERMDQPTLDALCRLLPRVEFRQTYGMSELGVLKVKSKARDSLYMRIEGEGVESRVVERTLWIRSTSRMLGYLNAESPFDLENWYNTHDIVEQEGDYVRIVGRAGEVVNIGGVKFMTSEVERVALQCPGVGLAAVQIKKNPITGQHIELTIEPAQGTAISPGTILHFLKSNLQPHMVPSRVRIDKVSVGHRFKKV